MSSAPIEIRLPDSLLPGAPAALAELERLLAKHEGKALWLDGAWMLDALPRRRDALRALAADARLRVVQRYCRVDAYALSGWREVNARYAEDVAAGFPGVVLEAPSLARDESDLAGHLARAGLCVDVRLLADRLMPRVAVPSAFDRSEAAMLPSILAALSPAGLGGAGDATSEAAARAALEAASKVLGMDVEQSLEVPAGLRRIEGRVKRLELDSPRLSLAWGRSKGLRMQIASLRACTDAFALEVQGDQGGRSAFAPAHPSRPRVFLASDSKPSLHGLVDGEAWLQLEREIRLPVRADDPAGRKGYVRWRLTLRLDIERGGLDAEVLLQDAVPGQRYRLWVPLPFHPRPSSLVRVEANAELREDEVEGPWPASAVMFPVRLRGQQHELSIGASGLREAELFARRNDHVCALTLLRTHAEEAPPARCVRRLQLSVRSID